MSDTAERVPLPCPSCSPERETVHEVLSPGGQATVRCTDCDHVHSATIPAEETVELDVVVSQSGESFSARTECPPDEELGTGEEFLLETDEGVFSVRITSLELGEQQRTEAATAEDVRTVWTRAVGNVAADVTIHPSEGSDEQSYSTTLHVPGDYEFVVGEQDAFGDEEFTVEGVAVRDDASGYDHDKLDERGDVVPAKDVKRVYARDETSDAWSAW